MLDIQKRVLVTGVNGFIGSSLACMLKDQNRVLVRGVGRTLNASVSCEYHVGNMDDDANWYSVLADVSCVVHCAARVHVMRDSSTDSLAEYRAVNVNGTLNLARQAARAGVCRFVFISSIKVNGESNSSDTGFTEVTACTPEDAYGISKWEAEQALQQLAVSTGMELVIIRPPLVYGPGVKGNLLSLLRLARTGLPLPVGAIRNQRSMIYLGNLVDLIIHCIESPAAANQIFMVSDGHDLSTPELLKLMRDEMGLAHRLLPIPVPLLRLAGGLAGKQAMVARLCDSLQVDGGKARQLLGWSPPFSVEAGWRETIAAFLNANTLGRP